MLRHFDDENIISDKQHGFRKGHSCETQLITTVNYLLASADVGNRVDIVAILDFSKAFAMVSHRRRPAPMAHSYRLGLETRGYQVRIPVGTDICHRGCAYTVLQTVQRHGVYSAAYGTVHYKEPLKSFEIRVGHSPGFGLPSVAILP